MSRPRPCVVVPPEETDPGVSTLLWSMHNDDSPMRIDFSRSLISPTELRACVFRLENGQAPHGVAQVRWELVRRRATLQHLYDTLQTHGLPVYPVMADAFRSWHDLHDETSAAVAVVGGPRVEGEDGVVQRHQRLVPRKTVTDLVVDLIDAPTQPMFNHLWVACRLCRMPLDEMRKCHAMLGMDIRERLAHLSPQPMVGAYVHQGAVVPLLLWTDGNQSRVAAMVQEYLHMVFGHIPSVRVWHFCLIPQSTPVNLVARNFRNAHILPNWHDLLAHVLPARARQRPPSFESLEQSGNRLARDPERWHMYTTYDAEEGPAVMWFGQDVFFYVVCAPADQADHGAPTAGVLTPVTNVRLPMTHADLPAWVLSVLEEYRETDGGDLGALEHQVDGYLRMFHATPVGRGVQLLRRISWAYLPLHWQPVYLRGLPVRITRRECRAAQRRLVRNIRIVLSETPRDEEADDEAVELLAHITNV